MTNPRDTQRIQRRREVWTTHRALFFLLVATDAMCNRPQLNPTVNLNNYKFQLLQLRLQLLQVLQLLPQLQLSTGVGGSGLERQLSQQAVSGAEIACTAMVLGTPNQMKRVGMSFFFGRREGVCGVLWGLWGLWVGGLAHLTGEASPKLFPTLPPSPCAVTLTCGSPTGRVPDVFTIGCCLG